jgi:lipid-A-disaccharide synthase
MVVLNQQDPALHFVIPAANNARREQIQALLDAQPDLPVSLVDGQSRTVMAAADVVLMASGTATLEGLLLTKPMVVGYRVGAVTYAIVSRLIKSEFVSLPNLLCRQEMVPELIQEGLTTDAIVAAVRRWFDQPEQAQALKARFQDVHQQLRGGASEKAAAAVAKLLEA